MPIHGQPLDGLNLPLVARHAYGRQPMGDDAPPNRRMQCAEFPRIEQQRRPPFPTLLRPHGIPSGDRPSEP